MSRNRPCDSRETADANSADAVLGIVAVAAEGYVAYKAIETVSWSGYVAYRRAQTRRADYAIVAGASEGVGLKVSLDLADHGANLVLVSCCEVELARVANYVRSKAPWADVLTVAAAVTADGAAQKVSRALDAAGVRDRVYLLVCNASDDGVDWAALCQYLVPMDDKRVRWMNGKAANALVSEFLPDFMQRRRGTVMCI